MVNFTISWCLLQKKVHYFKKIIRIRIFLLLLNNIGQNIFLWWCDKQFFFQICLSPRVPEGSIFYLVRTTMAGAGDVPWWPWGDWWWWWGGCLRLWVPQPLMGSPPFDWISWLECWLLYLDGTTALFCDE